MAVFGLAVRFLPIMEKVEEPELVARSEVPVGTSGPRPREELEDAAQDRHLRREAPPALEAPRRCMASGSGSGPPPFSGWPTS